MKTTNGPATPVKFSPASTWKFYGSIVKLYWKSFVAMLVMTFVYSGISGARLLTAGLLVAALEVKSDDEASQEGHAVFGTLERGWTWLYGEGGGLTTRLREDSAFFFEFLQVVAGAFAIAAVFMAVAFYVKEYIAQSITLRATVDVRKTLFNHLTTQTVSYFNRQRSGDVISRLTNDLNTVQLSFRFFFLALTQEPIKILVFLGIAYLCSPFLFAITIPFYAIIMWPLVRAGKRILKHGRGRQQKLGHVTEAIQQLFSGIRTVKSFGMEESEQQEFDVKNTQLVRTSMKVVRAKAKGRALQELLYNLGVATFLFVGVWLLTNEVMGFDIATLAVFIGALIETYKPTKSVSRAWTQFQESRAGVERVTEVLRERPVIQDDSNLPNFPGLKRQIVLEDVCFSYEQDEELSESSGAGLLRGEVDLRFSPAVRNVSLAVEAGEVIAIVGPSGSGKSTLVDLIARFYDPQQGRILVDGVDIRGYGQSSYVRSISVVSQDPFLFNTSILENLRYGREIATDQEVIEAAKVAFAHEFIEEQSEGYDTVIGDRGVRLSGGQRQRLTIARAILKNAPILILDEATSSLDSESEREVQKAMDNLMRHRTTFVVAHRLSTVVHADKIVVLDEGHIVETGRHEELLARNGKYHHLWLSQNPSVEDGSAA
ncbi:MAG: ABC transporter ATP-binding protein/permease [Planctomycetes bacterium]|nr:ABC transporter ATP-binding protein/permease [Planctomycetota bacterium]